VTEWIKGGVSEVEGEDKGRARGEYTTESTGEAERDKKKK
jgi:hypothetical protein